MSLFPAYGNRGNSGNLLDAKNPEDSQNEPNTSWLTNSSFQSEIILLPRIQPTIPIDSSDDEVIEITPEQKKYTLVTLDSDTEQVRWNDSPSRKYKKLSKKHKSHHKHHKNEKKYELDVKNVYFEDKFRDKGNLKVDTLCSRVRPLYDLSEKRIGFIEFKSKKAKSIKRYYGMSIESDSKKEESKIITKSKSEVKYPDEIGDNKVVIEQNVTQIKIREFNEKLAEEPTNINLWLQYANLEDHDEFKSTHSDCERMKYQRKLAIIERAMEINPNSKELLSVKLRFMSEIVPADQYSQQVENLISKDLGNILLWRALITATRSSVAMCTAPRIQSLYLKCFGTLHLWSKSCQVSYDNRLLNMLYQSLIFLRHAGLWEQMWESIRINLNLNLGITSKNSAYLKESIDEKKVISMEEVILNSRLPLNQLWLRIELLRASYYWMSVERDKIEFIGDSHRFVSPEDIAEYVHPLLQRESNLRLVIHILLILKIPLLPSRHSTFKNLDIEDENWAVDSIEPLLTILYPCVGEMTGHSYRKLLSTGLLEGNLTSGPQYLRFHPAQEHYLDFIRNVFHIIAENLNHHDRVCINIWWLRFERMLISLQKNEAFNSEKVYKKLRAIIKEFLKKEENRNNLHYYKEYALIERDMGRFQNSVNILKMAIQTKGNVRALLNDRDEKIALMNLYRVQIELLLDKRTWDESNNKNDIFKVFSQMTAPQVGTESLDLTREYLQDCYTKFVENSNSLPEKESLDKCFLPNFDCDAIACYIYLLYINNEPQNKIMEIFDTCLRLTQDRPHIQELFYENKIMFMQLVDNKNDIQKCVDEAMEYYPDNFYILSVFAELESELPHWNINSRRKIDRLWPAITMCLSGRARLHSEICLNDPAAMNAAVNKLLRFHEKLSTIPKIRSCPLIWRLYMLLLREHNLCEKRGEEVYHASINHCPWARCIYVDAAEIAPHFLTQIQDVIREKDLRMHVTLEELEILRGG